MIWRESRDESKFPLLASDPSVMRLYANTTLSMKGRDEPGYAKHETDTCLASEYAMPSETEVGC